jgi:outer membrane protein
MKHALILLFFGVATTAFAQSNLSLETVLSEGLKASKTLAADKAKVTAALARYEQVKGNLYPQMKLSAGYSRLSPVDPFKITIQGREIQIAPVILDSWQNRASLQQTVFTGGRAKFAEQSAMLLAKATEIDVVKDRDEVAMNLVNTYFNLYKLSKTKQLLAENKKTAEARLKDVRNMKAQGMALTNDELRVQLQLDNLEQQTLELENNEAIAYYNLSLMLNRDLSAGVTIDTATIGANREAGAIGTLLSTGVSTRSELKANELRTKAAENTIKSAKGAYLPTVSVGANYLYANPNQRVVPAVATFKQTWDVGATVSFDVTNLFTNKNNIDEATANLAIAKLGNDQLADAVRMDINAAYLTYQSTLTKAALQQKSIAAAAENYRVTNNRYQQNVATLTDLLDADALLLQAKINLATAKADAATNYYKLQKAMGTLTK